MMGAICAGVTDHAIRSLRGSAAAAVPTIARSAPKTVALRFEWTDMVASPVPGRNCPIVQQLSIGRLFGPSQNAAWGNRLSHTRAPARQCAGPCLRHADECTGVADRSISRDPG